MTTKRIILGNHQHRKTMKTILTVTALLLAPLAALDAAEAKTPQKPNLVLILADDVPMARDGKPGTLDESKIKRSGTEAGFKK